jgi:tRNA nucleotidyltransferase (CCA-adding enzyme)
MFDTYNLGTRLADSLHPEILAYLKVAATEAAHRNWRIYLVGGAVRDLALGLSSFDLDLAVEGDAIELAKAIAATPEDVTVHHRFNTARVKWGGHHIDLARSREETYARPGALPTVRPGTIEHDLLRRDFTINAMALSLNADDWGRVVDLYGGLDDLRRRAIRVLHSRSFIDDATRIWRAVRYEQRLDFCIEPETLQLLERDRGMLGTITADRLRYELECILGEARPEKIFFRADGLGLLATWHRSLKGDSWLAAAYASARSLLERPSPEVYLALLAWRLTAAEKEELIAVHRLTKSQSRALRDSEKIIQNIKTLDSPGAKPSELFAIFHGLSYDALNAAKSAVDSATATRKIVRYMTEWHGVSPELTGDDLKLMGVNRGPEIKALLDQIRDMRLDGIMSTREQEMAFVIDHLKPE